MNEVFLIGKIIKVEYLFIYKGKYTSIAKGFIKVKNQEILVMAIDDLADKLYISNNKLVLAYGKIYNNGILIKQIQKFDKKLKNKYLH